jgi:hypothetical protein
MLSQLSISLLAIIASGGTSFAQISEIDAYDRAVSSQSAEAALVFLGEFRSSHLVGDLIESLNPDVAHEVCARLVGEGPAAARRACTQVPQAATAEPADKPATAPASVQNVAPAAGLPTASAVPEPEAMTDEVMMNSGIGAVPASLPPATRTANQGVAVGSSATAAQTATAPGFRIQLLSAKSPTDTENAWKLLQIAYPDLLAGLQFDVVRVDLGAAKGVSYRGFAGPLANRDEANLLCAAIRSRPPHNDCFVAGR